MSEAQVVLRQGSIDDKDFIMATWLKGQYYGSNYWKQMPQNDFFKEYAKHISPIITNSYIEIAVLKEDPSVIIGFIVYYNTKVYWAYVKKDFRCKNILNLMLRNKTCLSFSGDTKPGHAIGKHKHMTFNPL